jgi:hypothetical protein
VTEMEPPVKSRSVSKSRLMDARQCLKKLWLATYRKEEARVSDATKSRFARGHEVGAVARDQVPGGIFVDAPGDLKRALSETAAALRASPRRAIFEATFSHGDCLVQVDELIPEGRGWRLCEVKSTNTAKPQHDADCAVQAWVVEGAGIKLARTELVHLNPDFVYDGSGHYDGLFTFEVMDDKIRPLVEQVPAWIAESQAVLAGPEPDIRTGAHCKKPYDCPFMAYCSAQEPPLPEYPVSLLPGSDGKALARKLAAKGYADLRDVPEADMPAGKFRRIWHATRTGKPYLDPQAAKVLRALPWPRYYFDFETIDFAVPRWAGARPWQQVPFQWSCHIEARDGSVTHKEYLNLSGENPARACAETMLQALGREGAILVYYASFEVGRIRELAEMFPDLARKLNALLPRIVDLHPIARDYYYHPAMKGSYSIKDVLPTVAPEMDYANLEEVQDGGMAQEAYMETLKPNVSVAQKAKSAVFLKNYCKLDTHGLVAIGRHVTGI